MSIKLTSVLQITGLLLSVISLSYAVYVGHHVQSTKDITLRNVDSRSSVTYNSFRNTSKALKQLGFTNDQINNVRKNAVIVSNND